jgi:hypothetical protein
MSEKLDGDITKQSSTITYSSRTLTHRTINPSMVGLPYHHEEINQGLDGSPPRANPEEPASFASFERTRAPRGERKVEEGGKVSTPRLPGTRSGAGREKGISGRRRPAAALGSFESSR